MREEYLNAWTLRFKEPLQEVCFCQLREDMFRSNMLCMFIVWIFIVLCQFVIIPRSNILTVALMVTTVIISAGCVLVMAEEYPGLPKFFRDISGELIHDRRQRTTIVCAAVILMSAASSMGLTSYYAADNLELIIYSSPVLNKTFDCNVKAACVQPKYVVFSWVLCLVALATALKLYYLVKTILAFGLVTVFCILILFVYPDVFSLYNDNQELLGISLPVQMVILLTAFLTMVIHHARLVEVISRLDFIWKNQAEQELTNMKSNRHLNDTLIKNIIPDHVASYYLTHEMSDDIYSKSHDLCGVMFASIPNFQDFYSEDMENGKACIRILNEIICDFDALLDEPRFVSVEKIKTVGQ
jgi:adenylate cyclase 8